MKEVVAIREAVVAQESAATRESVRIPKRDTAIKGRVCSALIIKPTTSVKPFAKSPTIVCGKEAVPSSVSNGGTCALAAVAQRPYQPTMAAVERLLPRSVAKARLLFQAATKVLAIVDGNHAEESVLKLSHAIRKLGRTLVATAQLLKIRKYKNPMSRPAMTAKLRNAAKDVAINIVSVKINVEKGANFSLGDLSDFFASISAFKKKNEKKDEEGEKGPAYGPGGLGDPDDPNKKKMPNHFIVRRDIPGCPYAFPPDRKSLKHIPTGKTYAFSGEKTINLVNRLTGGMMHDDWHVQLSGDDINHLRSTCRDFLNDCVVREEYTGSATGNRRWSGRVRLKGKND